MPMSSDNLSAAHTDIASYVVQSKNYLHVGIAPYLIELP